MQCPELYNALGLCYSRIDSLEMAENYYKKSLELFPENIETICNLAAIKGKRNMFSEALQLYEELIKVDAYDATILNNIAWCLEKTNNLDEAIKYYYRALAKEPWDNIFRLNLSECLYAKGYLVEAIGHLEEIIKNHPDNRKAWEILGKIYDKSRHHSKAIDCYNKALGLE